MLLLRFLGRERLTPLIILVLLFHRAAVEAAPVRAADPVVEADQAADMGQAQGLAVVAVVQGPVVALAPVAEDMAADPVVEADQAADMGQAQAAGVGLEAAPVRAADPVVEADQAAGVVAVVQGPVRPEIVMKVVDRPARAVMTASHQAVVTSPP